MNLNTLAKLSGVSLATVSKAFSGSDEISEETRQRIFSLAKEHGVYDRYNKNKYDKKVVAVICPELNSEFYNRYVTLLDEQISALGGIMTVSVSNFDASRESTLIAYYSSYCKVDGIISIGQHARVEKLPEVPIFALLPTTDVGVKSSITSTGCMNEVIGYLKENGHTRIGFIGEGLTSSRLRSFEDSMRFHCLDVENKLIKVSNTRFLEAGLQVMDGWFEEKTELPTAIVAAYDYIAIGAIKSIRRHGLGVPEDISVVGMDDINVANYLETSLSSVKNNTEYICKKAAEIIMKMIKNPYYSECITLQNEFVPRGTTGKAKG